MKKFKDKEARERYVERYLSGLFAGRKGHGQSEGVVYRVLRPDALRRILRDAYDRGMSDLITLNEKDGR